MRADKLADSVLKNVDVLDRSLDFARSQLDFPAYGKIKSLLVERRLTSRLGSCRAAVGRGIDPWEAEADVAMGDPSRGNGADMTPELAPT